MTLSGQQLTIVDESSVPIIGAEVFSLDHDFTGISDELGLVDLSSWSREGSLTIRSLGYTSVLASYNELAEMDFFIKMKNSTQNLDDIVIVGRTERSARDVPQQIQSINADEIQSTQPQTAADALSQHGGVYVQKSQMGGGSPVIRGFEANRVLLVIDGVRMNNAIYRSGHLQNAITVDPAILERTDVIFGPNSLLYGSDALGGVIHFQSRRPTFSTERSISGGAYSRYASANNGLSLHADVEVSGQRWSSISSVTYSTFGDLRAGSRRPERYPDFGKRLEYQSVTNPFDLPQVVTNSDPDVQVGTAYDQVDFLQKIAHRISADQQLQLNLQYSTSSNVPRYDNLIEYSGGQLRWGEWYYGPQNRMLASMRYSDTRPKAFYDDLSVLLSTQRIDEDRYSRRLMSEIGELQQEDIWVSELNLDLTKMLDKDHRLDYGAAVQYNHVRSSAQQALSLGRVFDELALPRYADGPNHYTSLGAYALLSRRTGALRYSGGLRYSLTGYQLHYENSQLVDWPGAYLNGLSSRTGALTGSLGATWELPQGWDVSGMISTAFRAPNIDDLTKIRINGDEITFPNTALSPERSMNAELSLHKSIANKLDISATGYVTGLRDAIVRDDYVTPDGSLTWITQGDTLSVVANQNIGSARIYGLSTSLRWEITDQWQLSGSYTWTRGRETTGTDDQPLAHIPPAYGDGSLTYDDDRLRVQYAVRYNAAKPLSEYGGTVDNPDLATPEGALSWMTHNVYAQYQLLDYLRLTASIENITDIHYRPFASGVSAPGRNITLGVSARF